LNALPVKTAALDVHAFSAESLVCLQAVNHSDRLFSATSLFVQKKLIEVAAF
jgi:hypothetical protein